MRCPPIRQASKRDQFNSLVEKLGGRALDESAVADRETYLKSLSIPERGAYHRAFYTYVSHNGDIAAAKSYLDSHDRLKTALAGPESGRPPGTARKPSEPAIATGAQKAPRGAASEAKAKAADAKIIQSALKGKDPAHVAWQAAASKIDAGDTSAAAIGELRTASKALGLSDAAIDRIVSLAAPEGAKPSETAKQAEPARLGDAGRTGVQPEVPEPRQPARAVASGKETQIRIPGQAGAGYKARYEVRELADTQASHNAFNFEPNPNYFHTNDRDYSNPLNSSRVIDAAKSFQPEYLVADTPTAVDGPPVLDADGNALGGNNRLMTLQRVYQAGGQPAQSYKAMLLKNAPQFGVNVRDFANMKAPVLVRVIDDASIESQRAITELNVTGTAAMTQSEQGIADARRVPAAAIDFLTNQIDKLGEGGTLAQVMEGKSGVDVVNRLIKEGVFTEQERPKLIDDRGLVTKEGKDRVGRALIGRVFRDLDQLESTPQDIRNKLERIIAPLVRVSSNPEWDLTATVNGAVDALREAKAHGIKNLNDLTRQQTMFGQVNYTAAEVAVAKKLQESPTKAARAFNDYARDEADARSGQASLLGPPPSRAASFGEHFGLEAPDYAPLDLVLAEKVAPFDTQLSTEEYDRVVAKLQTLKKQATKSKQPLSAAIDDHLQQGGLFGAELTQPQQALLKELASRGRRAAVKAEQGSLFDAAPTVESRMQQRGEDSGPGPIGGLFAETGLEATEPAPMDIRLWDPEKGESFTATQAELDRHAVPIRDIIAQAKAADPSFNDDLGKYQKNPERHPDAEGILDEAFSALESRAPKGMNWGYGPDGRPGLWPDRLSGAETEALDLEAAEQRADQGSKAEFAWRDRRKTLAVNQGGLDALNEVRGAIGEPSRAAGTALTSTKAGQLAEAARDMASDASQPQAKRTAFTQLADALDDAASKSPEFALHEVGIRTRGRARHESAHVAQLALERFFGSSPSREAITKLPHFEAARQGLVNRGYKHIARNARALAMEASAHIVGGQGERLGLSLRQQVEFLDGYFEMIGRTYKADALRRFDQLAGDYVQIRDRVIERLRQQGTGGTGVRGGVEATQTSVPRPPEARQERANAPPGEVQSQATAPTDLGVVGFLDRIAQEFPEEPEPETEPVAAPTPQRGPSIDAEPPSKPPEAPSNAADAAESPKFTGTKNAQTERERELRGLSPVEKQAYTGIGEAFLSGRRAVQSGAVDPRALARSISENPKPLTTEQVGALGYHRTQLMNEHAEALDALAKATVAGGQDAIEAQAGRVARILEDYAMNDQALQRGGREQSAAFNARKMMIADDYSLLPIANRLTVAAGRELTPEENSKVKKLVEQENAKSSALQKRLDAAEAEIAKLKARGKVRELDAGMETKGARRPKEKLDAELKSLVGQLAKMSGKPVAEPELLDIVQESPAPFGDDLSIENPKVVKLIKALAKNRVEVGLNTAEKVTDSVYDLVKDHLPGVTKREIADVYSGYGHAKLPSKDELGIRLREVKRQQRLINALEDATEGQAPLRSGLQRERPSARVRELQRKVNDAMREHGIQIERSARSPEEQMASALDAAKTRLRNSIEDLNKQIAAGSRAPRSQKPVPYDEEATALKAERDRLSEELDKIEGPRKLTDAQRIEIAKRATQRQIEEYDRRIQAGDVAPKAKGAPVSTPELEALRQQRADLKKQFDELRDATLTPEQKQAGALAAYKRRLAKEAAEIRENIAAGNFAKKERPKLKLDQEAVNLQAERGKAREELDKMEREFLRANRSKPQKFADAAISWHRTLLLSGIQVGGKLTGFAAGRMITTPLEMAIAQGLRVVPGIRGFAQKSALYGGFNPRAEAAAALTLVNRVLYGPEETVSRAMWNTLRPGGPGKSLLDLTYGSHKNVDKEFGSFVGRIHGALKTQAKIAAFQRGWVNLHDFEYRKMVAAGISPEEARARLAHPDSMMAIGLRAYEYAQRSIMLQDNWAVNSFNGMLASWAKSGGIPGKAAAAIARFHFPIVKVGTNLVIEGTEYAFGSVKAPAKIAQLMLKHGLRHASENATQEEADYVMRNFSKGGLGLAVLGMGLLGWFGLAFGGYSRRERKKDEKGPQPGGVQFLGVNLPRWAAHHPVLELGQMAETARQIYHELREKGQSPESAVIEGASGAALGLAEEVPFIGEVIRKGHETEGRTWAERMLGGYIKELTLPPDVPRAARSFDPAEKGGIGSSARRFFGFEQPKITRKPEGVGEEILAGVPDIPAIGLRARSRIPVVRGVPDDVGQELAEAGKKVATAKRKEGESVDAWQARDKRQKQRIGSEIRELLTSEAYRDADAGEKKKLLQFAITRARANADAKIQENGAERELAVEHRAALDRAEASLKRRSEFKALPEERQKEILQRVTGLFTGFALDKSEREHLKEGARERLAANSKARLQKLAGSGFFDRQIEALLRAAARKAA